MLVLLIRNLHLFVPTGDGNGKVRASHNAPVTVVTFHRLYWRWETVFVFNQDFLSTQIHTNMASFTPLVEDLYGCPGIFAFLLFNAVFKLCFLG